MKRQLCSRDPRQTPQIPLSFKGTGMTRSPRLIEMGSQASLLCAHRLCIQQTINYSRSKPRLPKETTEINESLYFVD